MGEVGRDGGVSLAIGSLQQLAKEHPAMPDLLVTPADKVLPAENKAVTSVAVINAATITTADPLKPRATPTQAPVKPADVSSVRSSQEPRVHQLVQAWAEAWGQKNLDAYFAAYSSSLNPGSGDSRPSWEEQRRSRILSKKKMQIEVTDHKISFSNPGSQAIAVLTQSYQSGPVATVSHKALELSQEKGQWLITREWVNGS